MAFALTGLTRREEIDAAIAGVQQAFQPLLNWTTSTFTAIYTLVIS